MAFSGFAARSAHALGSWQASALALLVVVLWVLCGLRYGFMDPHTEFVIDALTTVWTFLAVGLIQNTANRDTEALQAKLDEIVRALPEARNDLIACEKREDAAPG